MTSNKPLASDLAQVGVTFNLRDHFVCSYHLLYNQNEETILDTLIACKYDLYRPFTYADHEWYT